MTTPWTLLTFLLFAYMFGTAMWVIVRRRGFTPTVSWLLMVVAFPVVGATIYWLLANPRVSKTVRLRKQILHRKALAGDWSIHDADELPPHKVAVARLAENLTGLARTESNTVEVLTDNSRALNFLEAAIAEATQSVWAEYYIVKGDVTGRRFLDRLTARARDGLDVRLLYDAVGSSDISKAGVRALQEAGGYAEAFLPVNPLRRRWSVHLRNHRKILVCDGHVGFVGGMNVGDEYIGRDRETQLWRDSIVQFEGPAAHQLAGVFVEDWCFTCEERLTLPPMRSGGGHSVVAVLPSGPDEETNATSMTYFSAIGLAVERCWLVTPYFVPDAATRRALQSAALRGVDVRIVVSGPRTSDVPIAAHAGRSYYPGLLRCGVRIFEYRKTTLHSKMLAVDGWLSMMGSANLDMRSFRLNFECGALILDETTCARLELEHLADQRDSDEVTLEAIEQRGPFTAVLEGAAQLLSPIL